MKNVFRRVFAHASLWTAIALCSPTAALVGVSTVSDPVAMNDEIRLPGNKPPRATIREEWIDMSGLTVLGGVTTATLTRFCCVQARATAPP